MKELINILKELETKINKETNQGHCIQCPLKETCDESYYCGGSTICNMVRSSINEISSKNN